MATIPSSLQQPASGCKSIKFASATNPLDPILQPFESENNSEEKSLQQALSDNVNKRLTATIQDLQHKHATGQNEVDHPDRAPTGPIYRAIQQQPRQEQEQQDVVLAQQINRIKLENEQEENGDDNDDDDEFDNLLNDAVLDDLQERRLQELKQQHYKLAAGHGQYRTIRQDEFLDECNTTSSSTVVVVHFAHDEFLKCRIMDQHLQSLAQQYYECKFVRILAPSAPFFVQKLAVKTLPTLLVFKQGKLLQRLVGFEGLVSSSSSQQQQNNDSKYFETWRLAKWLADTTHAFEYKGPQGQEREDLLDQKAAAAATSRGRGVYRGGQVVGGRFQDDCDA